MRPWVQGIFLSDPVHNTLDARGCKDSRAHVCVVILAHTCVQGIPCATSRARYLARPVAQGIRCAIDRARYICATIAQGTSHANDYIDTHAHSNTRINKLHSIQIHGTAYQRRGEAAVSIGSTSREVSAVPHWQFPSVPVMLCFH